MEAIIIRLIIYSVFYILLNLQLASRQLDEITIFKINGGVAALLSSLLNAVSYTVILKRESDVGCILFVIIYVGVIVYYFLFWKKYDISNTEMDETQKNKHVPAKTLGGSTALAALAFVRTASDETLNLFNNISFIILIFFFLFCSLFIFIGCKAELLKLLNKKERNLSDE